MSKTKFMIFTMPYNHRTWSFTFAYLSGWYYHPSYYPSQKLRIILEISDSFPIFYLLPHFAQFTLNPSFSSHRSSSCTIIFCLEYFISFHLVSLHLVLVKGPCRPHWLYLLPTTSDSVLQLCGSAFSFSNILFLQPSPYSLHMLFSVPRIFPSPHCKFNSCSSVRSQFKRSFHREAFPHHPDQVRHPHCICS